MLDSYESLAVLLTSNSSKVNMCFKMTTLSQRELVSGSVCGSSSSQSVNFLPNKMSHVSFPLYWAASPHHLLRSLDDLLLVFFVRLGGRVLLTFVGEIRRLDSHLPVGALGAQPEIRVVQHLHGQFDRLGSEIHHERVTLELALVVFVHLDARFPRVDLLGDDSAFGKDALDFFQVGVERDRGDVDGRVDSRFLGLLGRLLLFRRLVSSLFLPE